MNAFGTAAVHADSMGWWLAIAGFGLGWIGQVIHTERRKHR